MSFIKLFIESARLKVHAQKNAFYFMLGYFISVFYYLEFNLFKAVTGIIVFVSVYSCIYVINDLFDCQYDKKHPIKKHRPIPSGRINPSYALILCGVVIIMGLLASLIFINPLNALCISLLVLGNMVYSHQFFKVKKSTARAALILAGLQYLKLLTGWSVNAGEINHPIIYFMIPASLYLYSILQITLYSDHYKGKFKIARREIIAGRVLMIVPAALITLLLFTELIFYIVFTVVPIYFAFLYVIKKLKLRDSILKINKYMTCLNSLLISLNIVFYLLILRGL